jgi:effector-binding domain-containing protein
MGTTAIHEPRAPVDAVRIVDLIPFSAAVVRVSGPTAELPHMFADAFAATARAITTSRGRMDGPPFARYLGFGPRVQAEVGFPFVGRLVEDGHVYRTELPGGRAVTATHVGPYETIGTTWDATRAWIDEQGLEVVGPAWERYLTGPEDPGPPVTEIFWPIR